MTLTTNSSRVEVLAHLSSLCDHRGLSNIAKELHDLQAWVCDDMAVFEQEISTLHFNDSNIHRSAEHLLDSNGKYLRPLCVILASKLGDGFNPKAKNLALAVELIHTATLLHDDVIDSGEIRRDEPTARMLYGNTASIFAGDFLLIQALKYIQDANVPGIMDYTLRTIETMIEAEVLQLEKRNQINTSREEYFRIIDGKTGALFRMATYAGSVAGGVSPEQCEYIQSYGTNLGISFQLLDDIFDLSDEADTGKTMFSDLHDGKMTYPMLLGIERTPALLPTIHQILDTDSDNPNILCLYQRVAEQIRDTNAAEDCLELAKRYATNAIKAIEPLPESTGKNALIAVAKASVYRKK